MNAVVRVKHIRAADLCMDGSRAWFKAKGWSWSDFLHNGLPVEQFEATGDALALRVAAIARAETTNG